MKKILIAVLVVAAIGWCVFQYAMLDRRLCWQIRALAAKQQVSAQPDEIQSRIIDLRSLLVGRKYLTAHTFELKHIAPSSPQEAELLDQLMTLYRSIGDPVIGHSSGRMFYDNPRREVVTITIEERPKDISRWEELIESLDKPDVANNTQEGIAEELGKPSE